MIKYLSLLFILLPATAFCQKKSNFRIQYVALKDTILTREITRIILKEVNSNDAEQLFKKGFGYITATISEFKNSDTLYACYVTPCFYDIKKKDPAIKYPAFYTYVSKRLVLIYLNSLNHSILEYHLSKRSKSKIRNRISLFLEKPTNRVFYDSYGKKVFRDKKFLLTRFRFDSGSYFFMLKNGSFKVQHEGVTN